MAKQNCSLSKETLLELLHYDQESGQFQWRTNMSRARAIVGGIAGNITAWGYRVIMVNKVSYPAHRLAWLYVYGEFPKLQIDHINGIRDDNRIINLRQVTNSINQQNLKRAQRNNKSGILGVTRYFNKWKTSIYFGGKSVYLGLFDTAEQAHNAYITAKRIHHPGCTI